MKKVIFTLVVLFLATMNYAQTTWDEAGIKKAAADFSTLMGEGKIGEAMDKYMHPKFFEKVLEMSGQDMPLEDFKKMVLAQAASTFSDEEIKMALSDFKINDMTDIIKEESIFYSLVNTSATMTMEYLITEEMEESDVVDLMKQTALMLKMQYGQDKVTIDEETKTITINATSKTIAIGGQKFDNWIIMDYKREQLINFEIINETVADKLDELD